MLLRAVDIDVAVGGGGEGGGPQLLRRGQHVVRGQRVRGVQHVRVVRVLVQHVAVV